MRISGLKGLRINNTYRGSCSSTSESEDQVESGFLLDVVVRKSSAVFKLLAGEDESLLIGRDTFLVLDLSLHVFN